MDDPNASIIYYVSELDNKIPYLLHLTSESNNRPPLLARVYRESRGVALATGKWRSMLDWCRDAWSVDEPREADWKTGKVVDRGHWEDTSRDSAYLNWIPCYDIDFGPVNPNGHPLTSLAQEAKRLNGTASFMLDAMADSWERRSSSSSRSLSTTLTANSPISRPPGGTPITQRK